MSFSPQLPKMAIQPFEPDPHTVYTIEAAAHFAQMSRRMILVYCKHGLISPAVEPREHGYCFNGNAVRTLRRIEDLRSVSGINVVGIKIILNLSNRVENYVRSLCTTAYRIREPGEPRTTLGHVRQGRFIRTAVGD